MIYPLLQRVTKRIVEIPKRGLPTFKLNHGPFDQELAPGIETTSLVWLTNPFAKNYSRGLRYEPCSPEACRWVIANADVRANEYYFVDVGCGKGRPLLIASQHEFAHLLGVDYSQRLCRRAEENLVKAGVQRKRFTIACEDATTFDFPEHNLLVYFFNPFDMTILDGVMRNLAMVAAKHSVIVGYEGPNRLFMERYDWLEQTAEGWNVRLYRSRSGVGLRRAS